MSMHLSVCASDSWRWSVGAMNGNTAVLTAYASDDTRGVDCERKPKSEQSCDVVQNLKGACVRICLYVRPTHDCLTWWTVTCPSLQAAGLTIAGWIAVWETQVRTQLRCCTESERCMGAHLSIRTYQACIEGYSAYVYQQSTLHTVHARMTESTPLRSLDRLTSENIIDTNMHNFFEYIYI